MTYQVSKTHYAKTDAPGYTPCTTAEEFMTNVMKQDAVSVNDYIDEIAANTTLDGIENHVDTFKEILSRPFLSMDFNEVDQSITLTREWDTKENFDNYTLYKDDAYQNGASITLIDSIEFWETAQIQTV